MNAGGKGRRGVECSHRRAGTGRAGHRSGRELVGEGARRLLAAALEAEVDAYLAAHIELVDERGHRLVVRNGYAPARTLTTAAGQVEAVNGPHLVALVRAGASFERGELVERAEPDHQQQEAAA